MTDTELFSYAMPSLGADMDEGAVIEWLVEVGDTVERGQVVARVETEKSDIDIETWRGGTVAEIVVGAGETVPVGTVLMHLHANGAEHGPTPLPSPAPTAKPREEISFPLERDNSSRGPRPAPADRAPRVPHETVWASPLARRLAGERGIALLDIDGTGPGGAIRSSDLPELAALQAHSDHPPTAAHENEPRSRTERIRSVIAVRMARSNAEIPHYRLQYDIDLGPLTAHLSTVNAERPIGERIVPAAALVRAVALTAQRHPELNGTWRDGRFRPGLAVNVSVAISLRGGGLVTPTIRHADDVTLDETMRLLREFTTVARTGTLRSEWTAITSSITVTNLGDRGADLVHGLISPPEVALVGFGRIAERPMVVDGVVVARPVVIATLAADHRATDGAIGSRFLSTLANTLQHPEQL
ncbi:MAG: dihydrolipoamide acetyltransferase family protein [Ilumatobacter sp.]|uniref:dihydrolipoamide acetyltransferase family protein n=1 Tax=Ilumatobacter sp. TaxID=1967498 RepID=UPI00329A4471